MTRRAWLNLRHGVPERWAAWTRGLERLGYAVVHGCTMRPGDADILVTWNRLQEGRIAADAFESRGRPVIVTENATWGNDFNGDRWYHVARGRHNTAGNYPVGDASRWDGLGVELPYFPSHGEGGDTLILPSRGIGPPGIAMPLTWTNSARKRFAPCRVREHPGQSKPATTLEEDLARAARVVTWGSGAAVKALLRGVPVQSEMPNWIGEQDNSESGRLAMFRRLAWAQWRLNEIANGEPVARLVDRSLRA